MNEIVPIMIEQEEKKRLDLLEKRLRMKSDRLMAKNKDNEEEFEKFNLTGPLKEVKLVKKDKRRPRRNSSGSFTR